MPKVRPLGESAKKRARWNSADENFRRQVAVFLAIADMKKKDLAACLCVTPETIHNWMKEPGRISKQKERELMMVFEQYGVPYDPSWGEAKA